MNTENIVKLAEFVADADPSYFNMNSASQCILGHASKLWPEVIPEGHSIADEHLVAEKLGITYQMTQDIFYYVKDAVGESVPYRDINQHRAATALHRLAMKGVLYF